MRYHETQIWHLQRWTRRIYADHRDDVVVVGWECLAKGFMCGKWTRADGEGLREIELGDDNAPAWREMQLKRRRHLQGSLLLPVAACCCLQR